MDRMSGLILREAKKAGMPIRISHSHNTQSEGGLATKIYKWYAGQFINLNATNLVACSNSAGKWLFSEESKKALILKNGIEQELFTFSPKIRSQIREELKLDDGIFVIGHVGRFCHQKNHSMLIDIFARFNERHRNSILILVGDGPLRNEIERKIKNLNLVGKVRLLGIRSDIYRLLQAFDTFAFPSLHEGLPVSLIEAQGSGLPCLISDQISREVDMEDGLIEFLPLNDLYAWTNKLLEIALKRKVRFSNLIALSNKGYNIRETASRIEDFYLNAAGGYR